MICLIVISTGPKYHQYIEPLLISAHQYLLPHEVVLFTDSPNVLSFARQILIPPRGYPLETLHRYHTILEHEALFTAYSHLFYIDVDCLFIAPVGVEILGDGITATLHAGFKPGTGDWETRTESTAYVALDKRLHYFCGGFNGGERDTYLAMADDIVSDIDADTRNKIIAKWHDESHLNSYLAYNLPAVVLPGTYCYSEPEHLKHPNPDAKILCLEKSLR